jgi:hypothetical protein
MPVPHPGIAEIARWCDGLSDAREARTVAVHLARCVRCREHAEILYDAREQSLLAVPERRHVLAVDLAAFWPIGRY